MAHCIFKVHDFIDNPFSGLEYKAWVQPTGEETFSAYESMGYYSQIDFSDRTSAQINTQMIADIKFQVFNDSLSNGAVLEDSDIKVLTTCVSP